MSSSRARQLLVQMDLIAKMSEIEARLAGATDENLQLLGLLGSFIRARESIVSMAD